MRILLTILHIIFAVGLVVSVVLQSGRSAGISGAIAGGAQAIFGKKKGIDEFLGKISTIMAIGFLLSALILAILVK